MRYYLWICLSLISTLIATLLSVVILAANASAAVIPEDLPETSSPEDVYIQGAAESDEYEYEEVAPPSIVEDSQEYDIPLGYSGNFDLEGFEPPENELTVLQDIRDILSLFLALFIIGVACLIVRVIVNVSLKGFTRYTGL